MLRVTSTMFLLALACVNGGDSARNAQGTRVQAQGAQEPTTKDSAAQQLERDRRARNTMVREQIVARGVEDERVLAAMRKVPRHAFVPEAMRALAYEDQPLPIGHDQTISQPYVVAFMTEQLRVTPDARVLEVGTGSGYQAAVLAELVREVYSIEIVESLAKSAQALLARLGYTNVFVRHGDGYGGWPEHAPFDAIVVTAAPPEIPAPLKQQLAPGGRMVIPVGRRTQELRVITRTKDDSFDERTVLPVRFVPMTGRAQDR